MKVEEVVVYQLEDVAPPAETAQLPPKSIAVHFITQVTERHVLSVAFVAGHMILLLTTVN